MMLVPLELRKNRETRLFMHNIIKCKILVQGRLLISGVASLDLMLGHTFYNRSCLATGMLVHTCIYIWLKRYKAGVTIAKLAM